MWSGQKVDTLVNTGSSRRAIAGSSRLVPYEVRRLRWSVHDLRRQRSAVRQTGGCDGAAGLIGDLAFAGNRARLVNKDALVARWHDLLTQTGSIGSLVAGCGVPATQIHSIPKPLLFPGNSRAGRVGVQHRLRID